MNEGISRRKKVKKQKEEVKVLSGLMAESNRKVINGFQYEKTRDKMRAKY